MTFLGQRGRSLRGRLTALSAALIAVALVVGAVALTGVVSESRIGALDRMARARAITVARLAETGQLPDVIPVSEPGEIAQVLAGDGSVVATSENASRTLPVVPAGELGAQIPDDAGREEPSSWTTTTNPYTDKSRVAALPVLADGAPVTVVVAVPLSEVDGVLRALRVALWGVVPVLTLLVGAVVWITSGRALRPVEELRSAAEQIARSGSGSLPAPAHDDEIGALARTLDDMLTRLRTAAGRQRTFVSDAAHELRSPVAALRATVDVAVQYPAAYSVEEFAAQTSAQVGRLQVLVDDLLVLARLGSRPPDAEVVDLLEIVREVVAAETVQDELREVTGQTSGPDPKSRPRPCVVETFVEGAGHAVGEPAATARIVRNLVANARRHARTGVWIQIVDGQITVTDDGPGIDPVDRERAFERFTRLDPARNRGDGGSGLGLAIARETAEHLGGTVVLDEAAAGGLSARVTLPVGEPTNPRT